MRLTPRSDTAVPPAVGRAERRFPEEWRADRAAGATQPARADHSAALRVLPLTGFGPGR